jgi:hypothetical protein
VGSLLSECVHRLTTVGVLNQGSSKPSAVRGTASKCARVVNCIIFVKNRWEEIPTQTLTHTTPLRRLYSYFVVRGLHFRISVRKSAVLTATVSDLLISSGNHRDNSPNRPQLHFFTTFHSEIFYHLSEHTNPKWNITFENFILFFFLDFQQITCLYKAIRFTAIPTTACLLSVSFLQCFTLTYSSTIEATHITLATDSVIWQHTLTL